MPSRFIHIIKANRILSQQLTLPLWQQKGLSVLGPEGAHRPALLPLGPLHVAGPLSVAGGQEEAGCLFVRGARRVPRWPQGLGHSRGSGSSGSLMTGFFLPLVLVWAQDIGLKMAFMKSVVQVTKAVENLRDTEDFQFAQKTTLTAILVVSPGSSALCTGGL